MTTPNPKSRTLPKGKADAAKWVDDAPKAPTKQADAVAEKIDRKRITADLPVNLYESLRIEAALSGIHARDIVTSALLAHPGVMARMKALGLEVPADPTAGK